MLDTQATPFSQAFRTGPEPTSDLVRRTVAQLIACSAVSEWYRR
jgi:hypothetical protein